MKDLMAAYQEQIKTIGFAGLGLQPATHPQAETNGKFIGSQKCESCHEAAYRIWKKRYLKLKMKLGLDYMTKRTQKRCVYG